MQNSAKVKLFFELAPCSVELVYTICLVIYALRTEYKQRLEIDLLHLLVIFISFYEHT